MSAFAKFSTVTLVAALALLPYRTADSALNADEAKCVKALNTPGARCGEGAEQGEPEGPKEAGREATRPNVLVILVDTLRADRLGCYGNPRGLTPFIDELAAKGALFRHAYSTSSWTCPAVASLFTSRFPTQHHVTRFASSLQDGEVTLAETLRSAGWECGGYVANIRMEQRLGYSQGFQRWHINQIKVADGAELNYLSGLWLDQPSRDPRLLYLHYMEPHAPYTPPEPHRSRWQRTPAEAVDVDEANRKLRSLQASQLTDAQVDVLASLYDGEVATLDERLRELFADLERRRFLDDAIVVLTADHGEEFREHGGLSHGTTLYNEVVQIPLLILAPRVPRGRVVEENVSIVDIAPTILELAGLPHEPRHEGHSLVPLMAQVVATPQVPPPPPTPRPIVLELEPMGGKLDRRAHDKGLVLGTLKLLQLRRGPGAFYDLSADPVEKRPRRAKVHPEPLMSILISTTADLQKRASVPVKTEQPDEATREKLRALGYHF